MRVLLAVHGWPPGGGGGTEIHARALAHALHRAGHQVLVLAREADPRRPDGAVREEDDGPLPLVRVNETFRSVRAHADTYRSAGTRAAVARLVARFRPDRLHVEHLTGLGLDVVDAAAEAGVGVSLTLNDYWLLCARGQLLDRTLERCPGPGPEACARCLGVTPEEAGARQQAARDLLSRADLLFAPSPTLASRFRAFGVPAARLRPLRQGIAAAALAANGHLAPPPPLRVGFAGSLMASKAPHVLLEAVRRLPPGSVEVTVWGAPAAYHGDDSYRGRLEPLLLHPAVTVAGPLPHAQMAAALRSVHALVVPSVWIENAPFVIQEAWAAGRPVVASDLGGMADMVAHERDGLLFAAGDSEALARALRRLLEEPGLLSRLAAGLPAARTIDDEAAELVAAWTATARNGGQTPVACNTGGQTPVAQTPVASGGMPVDSGLPWVR